jgi:dTDP-4-amino-4,6-dideoxygalactose transaminase
LYDRLLVEAGVAGTGRGSLGIALPKVVTNRHIFNQYVVRTSQRDQLQAYLQGRGIGTEVYYPVPMHTQECFAYLGYKEGAFPESEGAARETLALPIFPELTEAQISYVVQSVRDFFLGNNSAVSGPEAATVQSSKA